MAQALTAKQFIKPVDDYLRVATCAPKVFIADVAANVDSITCAYEQAKTEQAELLVLPELSLTGYSTADLFHNQHVLEQAERGLQALAEKTVDGPAMFVGAPLRHEGHIYNCAALLAEGKVQGLIPKTFLANYKEFYEERWFSSGQDVVGKMAKIRGEQVPFGTDLLFDINGTRVGAEICEDLFAINQPAAKAALAGAHVVANLSASNELIGKAAWRRTIIASFSGKTACAYAYTSAGEGESVADVVYGGHQIISENGRVNRERKPFATEHALLAYDVDRTYLEHERYVNKTWANESNQSRGTHTFRTIAIAVPKPSDDRLLRNIDPLPYVPNDPETLDERCEEIFNELAYATAQRIRDAHSESMVLGLSGGLDSTLALLIAIQTNEILGKQNDFVHTLTMPAHASSERTQDNATKLAVALGTTHKVVPVSDLTANLLTAIGHDGQTEDLAYENTQARIRTAILMNYANLHHGCVLGTGDMSEIAKGWSTFNGDHMSMFNPNCNVPKTLAQHLVRWYADHKATPKVRAILHDILDTLISPELTGNGDISQSTEELIGPYDLSDFFMFEHLRYGSRPAKIGYLALQAYGEKYTPDEVATWLNKFMDMHTRSQWKRDVAPNGPKIGSTALSPRGDLRMSPNTNKDWYKTQL